MPGLSCGMWDLVPQPRIEPRPPALRAQSLSHGTGEVPPLSFYISRSTSFFFRKCSYGKYFSLWETCGLCCPCHTKSNHKGYKRTTCCVPIICHLWTLNLEIKFFILKIYWSLVDLQYRVSFKCIAQWLSFIYIYICKIGEVFPGSSSGNEYTCNTGNLIQFLG